MKRLIIPAAAIVVVFALGFLYVNQNYLIANDKEGTSCVGKTGCDDKNKEVKAGGENESYEFVTDQACCDEMRSAMQTELLTVAGVKEVKFGSTCGASKMTMVTVYYAAGETSSEQLASLMKDKKYDCSTSCEKDGSKSGSSKDGCGGHGECPSGKQKSKDTKQL